jgi:hypothetical protein
MMIEWLKHLSALNLLKVEPRILKILAAISLFLGFVLGAFQTNAPRPSPKPA